LVLLLLLELLSLVLVEVLSVEAFGVESFFLDFLESAGFAVDDLDRLSVT
jgi:hypothetical protein